MEGYVFARCPLAVGSRDRKSWDGSMKAGVWGGQGRSGMSSVSLAPGRPSLKAQRQARRRTCQLLSACSRSLPSPGQWWETASHM